MGSPQQRRALFGSHAPARALAPVLIIVLLWPTFEPPIRSAESQEGLDLFEKRIRPLFVEICHECHSEEKKIKGGLRLDSREGWAKGGDSGPALVPGQPEDSLLIKAVRYRNEDLQMPPKRKLTDAQIADLERWVKLGAPDPRGGNTPVVNRQSGLSIEEGKKFWSYQPPKKSLTPGVKDASWPHSDIDRFLLAALEQRGLRPVAAAPKAALVRRAYFDLIGLPPTPEQIDAFVHDTRPDAFDRLVDHLLASPHFGERWGRHWLDVARFAESVTLRGFVFKEAWRYRDYVIESFNRDAPFDQFVREQIAGDLLPAPTLAEGQRQRIATTFLALGNTNLEEQDKKQLDMDVVDEQLDVIGKAFLAQTIGCARCHDHKFDPIPTRDYYALAGILSSTKMLAHANVSAWIEVPLPVPPDQERIFREHETALAALQSELKAARETAKALAGKSAEPKADAKASPNRPSVIAARNLPGVVVDSAAAKAIGEWKHSQHSKHYIGDGYWHDLDQGKGAKTLSFLPDLQQAGRYEVRLAYIHSPSRAANVPVTIFHADGETTIHVNQQEPPVLDGRFVSLGQFRFEANGFGHVLVANEGTRGYVTADAVQFLPAETVTAEAPRLNTQGTNKSQSLLTSAASTGDVEIRALEQRLKQLTNSGPRRPMAMTVKEDKAGDTRVHIRGSVHTLGEPVPRGFLTVAMHSPAPSFTTNASGRRELAAWLSSPENPLTARVMANRVWHWLFGAGLVRTMDNFGSTGEMPSHPELLDYLAVRFMQDDWSVKKLVRQIMLSHTYRLSTASDAPALAADPENRLFWRMNRRRLDAESIRDAMLHVSGQLQIEAGGPTFPPGLNADYGFASHGSRRSVYVPVFRNALPELFEVFDFADPSVVTGRRNASTVSPQALFLMNHPFVQAQAKSAARRTLASTLRDVGFRVDHAYRLLLGRAPTRAERELALKHLAAGESEEAWTEFYQALFGSIDFRYLN